MNPDDPVKKTAKEILEGNIKNRDQLQKKKHELSKGHDFFPSNADILSVIPEYQRTDEILKLLEIKPVRSMSGISVVAVMSEPRPCPHGKCVMCPKGEDAPQSYTGFEPAALRARMNRFDAYNQVRNRLKQYHDIGKKPEKVELIIMGGTFPSFPIDYQEKFISGCLAAMNRYPKDKPKNFNPLPEIQKENETARIRCIGMTFETRPDWCKLEHVEQMLKFGGTRVELGVQTTHEKILEKIKRMHSVADSINATKVLKDHGFKVCYHMMLGLPGSDPNLDFESFKTIFENPDFRPDMLKIYPTIVCKNTEIYDMWKSGDYKPYTLDETISLVRKIKKIVPEYVRIMRIQRDIPSTQIVAGIKNTNLRELANTKCRCIRCRQPKKEIPQNPEIRVTEYNASGGTEYFISCEENDVLFGFCRLRIGENYLKTGDKNFIRELHVYGQSAQIGKPGKVQHRGIGRQLLQRAEEIAKGDLYVISGIGAREYYRKLGYELDGYYMLKEIRKV
jgi:elongator complex protein 3